MTERRVAGHSFENDSMDARCTLTHTGGDGSRCPMTRTYLWTAQDSDIGKVGFAGYGSLNNGELSEIRADEQRIRGAAWAAVLGVCSA
jgi:hypothetical protein